MKSSECCGAFDLHLAISSVSGAQLSLMKSQRRDVETVTSSVLTGAAPAPQVGGAPENKSSRSLVCPLLMLF